MPGFTNPFYSSNRPEIPPAPQSSASTRPSGGFGDGSAPPAYSSEPKQYSSLSDLTRGQQRPVPPPPPARPAAGAGTGAGSRAYSSGGAKGDGRYMPPPPGNYGVGIPPEPPRRNVAHPVQSDNRARNAQTADPDAPPSGAASYLPAGAQGYANTASSYASAGASRAKDGFDSVFTQQNRDKVVSGVTGVAATGAKLLGKGAWQLGKFAANGGKT